MQVAVGGGYIRDVANATFTHRQAFLDYSFTQSPLLSWSQFQTEADKRGMGFGLGLTPFSREPWETLDREDLLPPVAYSLFGHWDKFPVEGYLDGGFLLVREETGHIPWDDLRARADALEAEHGSDNYYHYAEPLYSPWQLLALYDLLQRLYPAPHYGALKGGLDAFVQDRQRRAASPPDFDHLRQIAQRHRKEELALYRVQNFLAPYAKGGRYRGAPVVGVFENGAEWVREQEETFDFSGALAQVGMSSDQLKALYESMAQRGEALDPAFELFDLVEEIRRDTREQMTGRARLTLDCYDAARVFRIWYRRVTGVLLPYIDTAASGRDPKRESELKTKWYETDELRGNRAALPGLLEHHGLYPWRVQLVVEGPSEIRMLKEIFSAWGFTFEWQGISYVAVGGDGITDKMLGLLAGLRHYPNYYYFLFDNHAPVRTALDELVRMRTIEGASDKERTEALQKAKERIDQRQYQSEEERIVELKKALAQARRPEERPRGTPEHMVWPIDLEASNFTLEEICAMINRHVQDSGATQLRIEPDSVVAAMAASDKGMAEVALEVANGLDPHYHPPSKPDLAEKLGRYATENPVRPGETDERPILQVAEHLLRLTNADRRLRGRLRQ